MQSLQHREVAPVWPRQYETQIGNKHGKTGNHHQNLFIFLGNGGGAHSRIWCRAESGEYNFDVIGLEEARKYQRGQTITIRIVDDRAYPA